MRHLETLLRISPGAAITGPAEMYFVLGLEQQIVASWQSSSRHLETWLDDQHDRGRLRVTGGPFADDTSAAVATAAAALEDTRRACSEVHAALERAQFAISELTAPAGSNLRHGHT